VPHTKVRCSTARRAHGQPPDPEDPGTRAAAIFGVVMLLLATAVAVWRAVR
jgi:hypothetical protein